MRRRDFVKTGLALAADSSLVPPRMWADVPDHMWEGYDFRCLPVTTRPRSAICMSTWRCSTLLPEPESPITIT
jgi:hypothetical protein